MRNNIKSNVYYSISSFVHEMNPLVKIVCSFIFVLILFLAKTVWLNLILLVVLLLNILLTNIPLKVYFSIVLKAIPFIFLIFIVNILFNVNINCNIILCVKCLEVVIYACIVSITTKPLFIVKSFNIMFTPLKIIGIPIHYISFGIIYFIQYIANAFGISKIISKNYKSKGVKGINKIRFKAVPLFVLSKENNRVLKRTLDAKLYDLDWKNNFWLKFRFKIYDMAMLSLYILILILTFFEEV